MPPDTALTPSPAEEAATAASQSWYFSHAGKRMCVEDLPWTKLAEIGKAAGNVSAFTVAYMPLSESDVVVPLVAACCAHLGIDVPEVTGRMVPKLFTFEDDSLPDEWDQGLPVPKAEDAVTVTTT
jgi:hypothetical protein